MRRIARWLVEWWPFFAGISIAIPIGVALKEVDLSVVRRFVPDVGLFESWSWPLYELADGIKAGTINERGARAWVDAMRRDGRVSWTELEDGTDGEPRPR